MSRMTGTAPQPVVLVAAVARNGVIGNGPRIPWQVPGEQAHFKAVTLGHVLVMGRTTYDSIGRPLPGRSTVVLTRDTGWHADGVHVAHDVEQALALAATLPGEVRVVGGAQVYAALLPHATEQLVSEIPLDPEGDVLYPPIDPAVWEEVSREARDGYDVVRWVRSSPRAARSTGRLSDGVSLGT
jgi:dihydrofolate reductase